VEIFWILQEKEWTEMRCKELSFGLMRYRKNLEWLKPFAFLSSSWLT